MRFCSACPSPICAPNKSGLCRKCSNAKTNSDPEIRARRAKTCAALYDDPAYATRHREAVAKGVRALGPAHIEKLRQSGRTVGTANLTSPEVQERTHSPECREVRRLARIETMLGWCPPERRDEYRHLVYFKRLSSAEARRIIESEIPGTVEHARRTVANNNDASRIRHEQRVAQAY